jgi:hypothetical protein
MRYIYIYISYIKKCKMSTENIFAIREREKGRKMSERFAMYFL